MASNTATVEHTHLRRPRGALAAAVALGLAGPLAASAAAEDFEITGRGYGHGVGMSQHGARGAALEGWDAPRILAHYYRGARLERRPATAIRVRLLAGATTVVVDGEGLRAGLLDTSDPIAVPGPLVARAAGGEVRLERSDGTPGVAGAPLRLLADDGVSVDGRRYRGSLGLRAASGGGVDVVNRVGLVDYLAGVVPREMPASWPAQALRAQAVAARSYAVAGLRPDRTFDVHADTRSQVYDGRDGEDARATAAVRATSGLVLSHGGGVVRAFFHSTSGGHTENVENVWGGSPRPYLVGVDDPFDSASPYHRWPDAIRLSGEELGRRLRLGSAVREFRVTLRGVSPRVRRVTARTRDGGLVVLTGAEVRSRLGLRDTWFYVNGEMGPAPAPSASRPGPVRYLVYAAAAPGRARARAIARRVRRTGRDVVLRRRTVAGVRRHLVVTGRFRLLANARRERTDLRSLGYPAGIGSARARPSRFIVVAGVRSSRGAAVRLVRQLRRDGVRARVLSRRRGSRTVYLAVAGFHRRLAPARLRRDELRRRGYRRAAIGPARRR